MAGDPCSLEICEQCKVKLVDFYHFKMRAELQMSRLLGLSQEISDTSEKSTKEASDQDKSVQNIVEIVKNFISRHSVAIIEEDEVGHRLTIQAKLPEDLEEDISIVKLESSFEDSPKETALLDAAIGTEELESEDYLDDYEMEEVEDQSDSNISEHEEQFDSKDAVIIAFEDSNSSYNQIQSASESASESLTSSNPRRPRRPETWISNKRKTLRNSGQTYLSTSGKLVPAKSMHESCGISCRAKCISKVSEHDRQYNFDTFWSLGDVVRQRKFIHEHITSSEPKRRRAENLNRTLTHNFYLEAKDSNGIYRNQQVCKKMFKNTLVISTQKIQCVVRKYAIEGFVDTRGKFERILTEGQKFAAEHVKQFPFFYIEQTMTKIQCYGDYLNECKEKGIEPVKEGNYRVIFDKQNQGSFLKTEKVGSCEFCHRYYKATDDERATLQAAYEDHISLGTNRKCRDRALGRIRHKRAQERRKAQRLEGSSKNESNEPAL